MQKKTLVVAVLAVLTLYAGAGFLAAPAFIKPRLVASLEQATRRSVHLGGLRINPFTFSATLEDFRLLDRDSTLLVSFRKLYVRYGITSVFRHVWPLAQFRLDTPYVAIRVQPDGTLSVSDLLGASPADSSDASEEPPRALDISDLFVAGGTIVFRICPAGRH